MITHSHLQLDLERRLVLVVEPVPVEAVAVVGVDPVRVAADMHPAREAAGSLAVAEEPVVGSLVVPLEVVGTEPALLEAVGRVVVLLAVVGRELAHQGAVGRVAGSLLEQYHIADLLVAHHTHLVDEKPKNFC